MSPPFKNSINFGVKDIKNTKLRVINKNNNNIFFLLFVKKLSIIIKVKTVVIVHIIREILVKLLLVSKSPGI